MKIRARKLVLGQIILLIFLMLSVFTAGISIWVWNDVRNDSLRELSYNASVIKNYYDLSFKQWELSLHSVGTRLMEINGEDMQIKRLEFANEALKIQDHLLAFGLADTTGQVVVFTGSQPGDSLPQLTRSENSRRSFLQAKIGNQLVIGEVYYFPNVKDWILPIRVPIRDENGTLLAVNTSAIDYSRLLSDLSDFGMEDKFHVHLVNSTFNTTQLYYPLSEDRYYETLAKNASLYDSYESIKISNNYEVFEAHNLLENFDGIGVKTELKNLSHLLIITVSKKEILASFWNTFRIILLTYLGLSLFLGYLYLFFRKKQLENSRIVETERANLKAIFESTNNIIGLFDTKQRIMEYNGAFAHYAKTLENIELAPGLDVFNHMKNQEIARSFKTYQVRAIKGEKFQKIIRYPTKDGELFLSFSYNPIYQGKKITGLSMFVQDVTELTQFQRQLEEYNHKLEDMVKTRTAEMEEKNEDLQKALASLQETQRQLIQSEKMASLGALAAGLGHEINNPLNFISNGVQALINELSKKYPESKKELKPFKDIIDQGVDRAGSIVNSLSHFSRQGESLTDSCDIHEILENCLVILHSKWSDRIVIDRKYSKNKVSAKGSEGKLHQAFLNVLSNAIQAIEKEGTITITTGQKGKRAIVSIQDDGIGMIEDVIKRITDPFFTTRAPGEGVGLGMFITQSIIEEHNGKMEVFSHPGEGTEILINV